MSDEEIEYLGASRVPKPGPQRPVTGIALNVEKSTNSDPYRLVFSRPKNNVIQVGRRPAGDSTRALDSDSGNAMFRCAVVSRKHAKIAFTDTGSVFIFDLHSHHGTHVRKPGQLVSKTVDPEHPVPLADGDVITFGKTVGRNEECVRPVVVRVELLRNPQPHLIKPLFVPSPASDKSSSGRYGIYTSPDSSDEMLDSEIEEVFPAPALALAPPPPTCFDLNAVAATPAGAMDLTGSVLSSSAARVLGAMRNIFIDNGKETFTPSLNSTLPPIDPWNSIMNLPSLKEVMGYNVAQPSSYDDDHNDEQDHEKSRSHSPMDLESPPPGDVDDEPPIFIGAWTSLGTPSIDPPRSSESSSRASPSQALSEPALADEPLLSALDTGAVGQRDRDEIPLIDGEMSPVSSQGDDGLEDMEGVSNEAEVESVSCSSSRSSSSSPPPEDSVASSREASPEVIEVIAPTSTDMKEVVTRLQNDITNLHAHRRKYRSRFNANVRTISDKLTDYDKRLDDITSKHDSLSSKVDNLPPVPEIDAAEISGQLEDMEERLDGLADVEVPDLQAQVDLLDTEVVGLTKKYEEFVAVKDKTDELAGEVREEIATLQGLIENMKQLRQQAQEQMDVAMKDVQDVSERTMAKITAEAERASMAISAQVESTSLKRKRADTDLDENDLSEPSTQDTVASTTFHDGIVQAAIQAQDPDETMKEIDFQLTEMPTPPPRKRLRKVASVMAHTATAVTIGAVATWSALAFL